MAAARGNGSIVDHLGIPTATHCQRTVPGGLASRDPAGFTAIAHIHPVSAVVRRTTHRGKAEMNPLAQIEKDSIVGKAKYLTLTAH